MTLQSTPRFKVQASQDSDTSKEGRLNGPAREPGGAEAPQSAFAASFAHSGSGSPRSAGAAGASPRLTPGSTFGVYEVGPCIGEGGMARIYQAEHAGLGRKVALKVLIDDFARDSDGRKRFLREARLAAAVKHPNVVNIFDVGLYDDIPYLVMELLEGQDLEQLLGAKGRVDEGLLIDIMIPVLAGLSAVHDAGIVHRDLKPGNIFLAKGRHNDLEPKLLDFGISREERQERFKLTTNPMILGTPLYMAPETLQRNEVTPRSDQYSVAVMMYECATGCTPYEGATFPELATLITTGQYVAPAAVNPELSKRLVRIIERAMSLQPTERFADVREMGRELLSLAGQRTRITWGLSFGDTGEGQPESTLPVGRSIQAAPSAPPPAHRRRPPTPQWFWFAPLLLVAALFAWHSRGLSERAGSRSGPPTAPREESRGPAASTQPGADMAPLFRAPSASPTDLGSPRAATDLAAAATVATGTGSTSQEGENAPGGVKAPVRQAGRGEGKASAVGAEAKAAAVTANGSDVQPPTRAASPADGKASADDRSARPGPVVRPVRRSTLSAAARRSTGSDAEPEWAIPPSTPSTGSPNLQYGPNGSPILD